MAMLTLRARNSGELVSVQLATITTVTATKAKPDAIMHKGDSEEGDSPVFLSITFIGDHAQTRFVTIDGDGDEDKTVESPDVAIHNFTTAAQRAERYSRGVPL